MLANISVVSPNAASTIETTAPLTATAAVPAEPHQYQYQPLPPPVLSSNPPAPPLHPSAGSQLPKPIAIAPAPTPADSHKRAPPTPVSANPSSGSFSKLPAVASNTADRNAKANTTATTNAHPTLSRSSSSVSFVPGPAAFSSQVNANATPTTVPTQPVVQPQPVFIQQPMMPLYPVQGPIIVNRPNTTPTTLPTQPPQPAPPMLHLNTLMSQLHLPPSTVPPPKAYPPPPNLPNHPPTVSWTAPVLESFNSDPLQVPEPYRAAFRQSDALMLQAVKERNHLAELARCALADAARQREVAGRYLAIVNQLERMVPPHVQMGVRMDLEEIGRFSSEPIPIVSNPPLIVQSSPTIPAVPTQPPVNPTSNLNTKEKSLSGLKIDTTLLPSSKATENLKTPLSAESSASPVKRSFESGDAKDRTGSGKMEIKRRKSIVSETLAESKEGISAVTFSPTALPTPASTIITGFDGDAHPTLIKHLASLRSTSVVCCVSVSAKHKLAFVGCIGNVKVFDFAEENNVKLLSELAVNPNGKYVRALKVSPDDSYLLVGGEAQDISIFSLRRNENGAIIERSGSLPTPGIDTYSFFISEDSEKVFSCGSNFKVDIWDIKSKTKVGEISGHSGAVTCGKAVCLPPLPSEENAKKRWWFFSGSMDCSVRVCDISEVFESSPDAAEGPVSVSTSLKVWDLRANVFSLDVHIPATLSDAPLRATVLIGLEHSLATRTISLTDKSNDTKPEEGCNTTAFEGCSWPAVRFPPGNLNGKGGKIWALGTNTLGKVQILQLESGGSLETAGEIKESDAVLCADIDSSGAFIVTGSSNNMSNIYTIGC
ncbi:Transducin-like enhancer protein 4 [Chytridiales sp. JEL 0842]|nr:Transducin-like enhancer protein 4 [Chytridiales sp. JEL 0842]